MRVLPQHRVGTSCVSILLLLTHTCIFGYFDFHFHFDIYFRVEAFSIPSSAAKSPLVKIRASNKMSIDKKKQEKEGLGRVLFKGGLRAPIFSSMMSSAASVELEGDDDDNNSNSGDPQTKKSSKLQFLRSAVLPRALFYASLFFTGYQIGVRTGGYYLIDSTTSTVRQITRRYRVLSAALLCFIMRDVWRSIPGWMKPSILKRQIDNTAKLFGQTTDVEEDSAKSLSGAGDTDDIADLDNIFFKLNAFLNVLKTKVPVEDDFNVTASFLALLQLSQQLKERQAKERDGIYASSGKRMTAKEVEALQQGLEFADWAYDEDPSGKPLKELLDEQRYALLKHDTTQVPGYLGHYLAISKDPRTKKAIIGVKGTSGFEDMITDMCASSSPAELPAPFADGANSTIRAHEGVLIASTRLCDDIQPFVENLLLPQGYKITVYGHSLGAASATLLAVLLKARIAKLRDDKGGILKVFAYASPPTLDLSSALACKPFVTTIVNNVDIIPRCNLSPLAVTACILQDVDDALKANDMDVSSSFSSSAAFLKQLKDGDTLLMQPEELTKSIDKGIEKAGDDEDHLYVCGDVVLLYDRWEVETKHESEENEKEKDTSKAYVAVLADPQAKPLRYIEFDERVVSNHMCDSYRESLRSIVSNDNKSE